MGCRLEGVENDYHLISGYFGGIGFEGLQELAISLTKSVARPQFPLYSRVGNWRSN
jgi:hypothetical protein